MEEGQLQKCCYCPQSRGFCTAPWAWLTRVTVTRVFHLAIMSLTVTPHRLWQSHHTGFLVATKATVWLTDSHTGFSSSHHVTDCDSHNTQTFHLATMWLTDGHTSFSSSHRVTDCGSHTNFSSNRHIIDSGSRTSFSSNRHITDSGSHTSFSSNHRVSECGSRTSFSSSHYVTDWQSL